MKKNIFFAGISLFLLWIVLAGVWIGGIIMGQATSDSVATGAPVDYVIILGCGLEGKEPGKCLQSRIDAALSFAEKNPDVTMVCSGGQGKDEEISEAEAIANALFKEKFPKKQILMEDTSRTTRENLKNTKAILDKREDGAYRVAVVSNEFHLYRSRNLAIETGFENPIAIAGKTPATQFYPMLVREICAVVATWLGY